MTIDSKLDDRFLSDNFKTINLIHYNVNHHSFKSDIKNERLYSDNWQKLTKSTWKKKEIEVDPQYNMLFINDDISLKIPTTNKELESVLIKGKYILDLKDNWDEEGSVGYTIESWKSAAKFIINFNRWIKGIFAGSLHLPKMHHGPKGTIDVVWHEDNFRLFVNIDYANNKGTFYSDSPNTQVAEGEFLLNDFKFNFFPLPFKY